MLGKLEGWDDTIAALATPQGIGAIGVIRISGKRTFEILNPLFPSKDLNQQASHTLHVGFLRDGNELLDEVVLGLYRGPKSYTGEDTIEISCHGSPFIQEKILETLTQHGARLARAGEFTLRAFLNGKLDLAQAEAVADIIASNTEASRRTALQNIRGGFSSALAELRNELIKFSALIELELDFSQEDVEFADRKQFYELIEKLQTTTHRLMQSFQLGNVIKHGVQVAIIGKPNAGKSTLLNTLLNEYRAIVSDIAGTTRDTVEEILNINGILFRLIDTAGIREHTADLIESIGVEKSLEKMHQADVVVYLFDVADTSAEELTGIVQEFKAKQIKYILVANKIDAVEATNATSKFAAHQDILFLSAKLGNGVEDLKELLHRTVTSGDLQSEDTIVTNARHYEALVQLAGALADVKTALDNNIPGDLMALDIRRSLHYLGAITGEITNEDQLDFIFSKFCIGK
jgi:tRNA modification GTPase